MEVPEEEPLEEPLEEEPEEDLEELLDKAPEQEPEDELMTLVQCDFKISWQFKGKVLSLGLFPK